MRFAFLFCLLPMLTGINVAQDTNFPTGPQYLVTGSPMFLHSIATPALSLSTPPASPSSSENDQLSQSPAPPAELSAAGSLSRIYWGVPSTADTGTAKVGENAEESGIENSSEGVAENASGQENLNKKASEIRISMVPSSSMIPSSINPVSIFDTGVTGMTSAESLRERGFGIPLGNTAAFWKTHKPRAPRVYTNADIQRLHQG